jgi:hypothetical protein
MERREELQPVRLFAIRLDSAKMKADIAPTATKKPTIAPFIKNLPTLWSFCAAQCDTVRP